MGTVAPVRKMTEEERSASNWYARLVDWWGFHPLDVAPIMGVTKGVKKLPKPKKVNRGDRVGPIVNNKLLPSTRTGPVSSTEVTPFEQVQLGLSKGAPPYRMTGKDVTAKKRGKK